MIISKHDLYIRITYYTSMFRNLHKKYPREVCDICGKEVSKRSMKKHKEQVHSASGAERAKFEIAQRLAIAETVRKNPRAFPCDQCDRSYTTNQKLKFHKMIQHENAEKKYPCHICGLKFKLQCYVKKHISQCHNPEDYIGYCEECGRGYKLAYQIRDCCHDLKIAKFRNSQQLALEPPAEVETLAIENSVENKA